MDTGAWHDVAVIYVACFGAFMVLLSAMITTKSLKAGMALKRQEVFLVANVKRTMLTNVFEFHASEI